jgi:superfamily II RNA helicase
LVTKVQGSGQFPYLVCLTKTNQWYVVTAADVVGLHADIPRLQSVDTLAPPTDLVPSPGKRCRGDDHTAAIAATMANPPTLEMLAPEVQEQLDRMREVEYTLAKHPASQWDNTKGLLKRQKRLRDLEEEWRDRKAKLAQYTGRYWQEFLNIMDVLKHFGGLDDNRERAEMAPPFAVRRTMAGPGLESGDLTTSIPPARSRALPL